MYSNSKGKEIAVKKQEYEKLRKETLQYFEKAGIALTEEEKERIEAADFGLGDVEHIGLESIVYVNTERCCAKEMVLFPGQICPEHVHPPVGEQYIGKEETFRCRMGTVYLYVDGEPGDIHFDGIPEERKPYFTVFHEIVLTPGEQYTLYPGTKHWFASGEEGAVVSEFSTHCYDEYDIFTDPQIRRIPEVED